MRIFYKSIIRTTLVCLVCFLFTVSMPVSAQEEDFTSDSWTIVITHRGTPLPDTAVNFLCNEVKPAIVSWIERDAGKYQQTKPFSDITCLQEQIFLSDNLLVGNPIYVEGQWITNPLNDPAVIEFIEKNNPALTNTKYVTVIHYIPYEIQFGDHMYSNKYDFIFIKSLFPNSFYPNLEIDSYGETMIHEFMHKLGASDKYDGAEQACLTNPATGQQYSGYDIMCHRIYDDDVYTFPPLSELIVSVPTAQEINWKLPSPRPIVDINITGVLSVGKSTKNVLATDYRNFIAGDPYKINITRISDNLEVFEDSGTLIGGPKQTIPIVWTPKDTSDYLVVAKGDTIVASNKITVIDFEVVAPVPELSTIVLMSAGLLGLFGFIRLRRRN